MRDAKPPEPPEGVASPLSSPHEVSAAWGRFRAGGVAPCPADGAPLALAVDGTAHIYRFVCTKCGAASTWFDAGPGGLRARSPRPPGAPPADQ